MSHGPENKRITLIRRRWFDILLYAFGGASVWFVLDQTLGTRLQGFTSLLERCSPFVLLVVALVFVSMSVALAGIRHTRGWLGLRCFVTYPPLWLPAMLGVVLLTLAADAELIPLPNLAASKDDLRWALSTAEARLGASVLMLLVLLFGLWRPDQRDFGSISARFLRMLDRKPESERPGQPISQTEVPDQFASLQTFESIRAWIADDTEVKSVGADRFRFSDIARRIADRLGRTGEAPTIAVVGPRGSGKSTLAELTRAELRERHPNVRLVRVSLWPFDSAEAAVRGILRKLIDELGEHAPTTALSGLSDDYAFAIEKAAGPLAGLGRLLRGGSDPDTTVKRLGDIAAAVGVKLVLWVEDSERFGVGSGPDSDASSERAKERLGPVHALLHLLDRCPAVSVVVADTSLSTRIDVSKIARFVERMPTLEAEVVWREIEAVRNACLSTWPRPFVDPAHPSHREKMLFHDHAMSVTVPEKRGMRETLTVKPNVSQAICIAVRNPRTLKSFLRQVVEDWNVLCGEVDFDSLLAISALKHGFPECFEIIESDIATFRNNWMESPERRAGPTEEETRSRLANRDRWVDPESSHSINRLIDYLFPSFFKEDELSQLHYFQNPQSFHRLWHRDYWSIFAAQTPIDAATSDQAVLQAIVAWKSGEYSELPQIMCAAQEAKRVEAFASMFDRDELVKLVSDVVGVLEKQSARQWDEQTTPEPLPCLMRMLRARHPSQGDLFEDFLTLVIRTARTHLPLAHAILYWLMGKSATIPSLITDTQQEHIRSEIHAVLVEHCRKPDSYQWMRDALQGGQPYVIRWLVWGIPDPRAYQPLPTPFADWSVIANTLVELAGASPELGIPICIDLFTYAVNEHSVQEPRPDTVELTHHAWRFVGHVDEDAARRLFPTSFDQLRTSLAGFQVPARTSLTRLQVQVVTDAQLQARLTAAIEWARTSNVQPS